MAFDFKKEYKEFYMPKKKPEIVNVPRANYIAVRGVGDPNEEGGNYKAAIGLLYAIAFTLKMSRRAGHEIEGFFDYVVPPLEGFWWQPGITQQRVAGSGKNAQPEGSVEQMDSEQLGCDLKQVATCGLDYSRKADFHWISVIRLPDFIRKEDFEWAVAEAERKKKMDCSKVEFLTIDEGLCVQIMHIGAYDDEPASIALMDAYLEQEGYANDFSKIEPEVKWEALDFSSVRLHHEIYLSDARKVEPARRKTVIRHPIRKK